MSKGFVTIPAIAVALLFFASLSAAGYATYKIATIEHENMQLRDSVVSLQERANNSASTSTDDSQIASDDVTVQTTSTIDNDTDSTARTRAEPSPNVPANSPEPSPSMPARTESIWCDGNLVDHACSSQNLVPFCGAQGVVCLTKEKAAVVQICNDVNVDSTCPDGHEYVCPESGSALCQPLAKAQAEKPAAQAPETSSTALEKLASEECKRAQKQVNDIQSQLDSHWDSTSFGADRSLAEIMHDQERQSTLLQRLRDASGDMQETCYDNPYAPNFNLQNTNCTWSGNTFNCYSY
jgi:hypothetical protein